MGTPPARQALELWLQRIKEWYPDLLERAYFLPAVHMNMTRYSEQQLAATGERVLVSEQPATDRGRGEGPVLSQSDVREDDCQQQVLNCLQHLSAEQKEVMFVLSQLKFGDYLNEPCYAAAASRLPRPSDLRNSSRDQGDFDVLIIHRHYGVILGEIKSVGGDKSFSSFLEQKQDQTVKKRVVQAIKQLQKGGDVVQHIVSDMTQRPRVSKTLIMPNIKREQLQRVLEEDESLSRSLSDCLGLGGVSDPTQVCLLNDDLPRPLEYRYRPPRRPTSAERRARWWRDLLDAAGGQDPDMTDDAYLDLITRLAGPATTVKVHCSSAPRLAQVQERDIRTPGEGVQETASRFMPADIVLHPSQLAVLNDPNLRLAYLAGPPGVGKSLMLLMKAREWLRQGKHVHLISSGSAALAATHMLAYQLECSAGPGEQQRVHVETCTLPIHHAAFARKLMDFALQHTRGQELYIIMDEATDVFIRSDALRLFVNRLYDLVPNLHLWAAAIYHELRPRRLTEVILTEPLRTPPSVTDIVREHRGFIGPYVKRYNHPSGPLPSYGPVPIRLYHAGESHDTTVDVFDCEECGREIARTLRHLGVGSPGRSVPGSPPPLTYRDVFVLTWDSIWRAEKDAEGNQIPPTQGVLRGLSQEGVPITVLVHDDQEGVRQIATNTGPDNVVVAYCRLVNGLERKVVVFMQPEGYEHGSEDWGKLWAMSRCTSQLIWLKTHPKPRRPPDSVLPPGYKSTDVQNNRTNNGDRPRDSIMPPGNQSTDGENNEKENGEKPMEQ